MSLDALGDEAVIGAQGHNNANGAAYVFVRHGNGWVQQAELTASDGASGDSLGFAVSLDALGDAATIGAPGHNGDAGAAYVFVRHGNGWVQQAELTASDGAGFDYFGWGVSMDALGDETLIGAIYGHGTATAVGPGSAYAFVRRGNGWVQQAELTASDGAGFDSFGNSVTLNALGDEAVIGAPVRNNLNGSAYVFVRRGRSWVQQAELTGAPRDGFGVSVSLDALGDKAVIGAFGDNNEVGSAYVFVRQGGSWVQHAELTANDGAPGDQFGWAVSTDALGDQAAIGAPFHNGEQGAAYVFEGI